MPFLWLLLCSKETSRHVASRSSSGCIPHLLRAPWLSYTKLRFRKAIFSGSPTVHCDAVPCCQAFQASPLSLDGMPDFGGWAKFPTGPSWVLDVLVETPGPCAQRFPAALKWKVSGIPRLISKLRNPKFDSQRRKWLPRIHG